MVLKTKISRVICFSLIVALTILSEHSIAQKLSKVQAEKIKQYEQLIKDNQTTTKQIKLAAYYSGKMANEYLKAGMYDNAIKSYQSAVAFNSKIGSNYTNRKLYNNIAMIYAEMNQLKNTQKYFEKSLNISRLYKNKHDIAASLMDVGTIHIYGKRYSDAIKLLEEALKISSVLNDAKLLRTCYNLLYQCYNAYGNKKKAEEHKKFFNLYDLQVKEQGVITRDRKNIEKIHKSKEELDIALTEKKNQELAMSLLEERKKRTEDSLNSQLLLSEETKRRVELEKLQAEKEKEEQKKKAEYQKAIADKKQAEKDLYGLYLTASSIGGLLLLLAIIAFIVALRQKRKSNKKLGAINAEIAKQKDEIESKNKDLQVAVEKIQFQNENIIQSINYAQRIQDAMLPNTESLKNILAESFIFFQPKDVVSGDFYWFGELNKGTKKHKIMVSAVDCTGHGVPGAFMSMLGFNLLNDIVKEGTDEPDQILNYLHNGIRTSLNQEVTKNRDGMDMTICAIDLNKKNIEFAGAQNPLIYIQDNEVFRVRGNKFPVGGYQIEGNRFTKHIIKADKPTYCYLFSDGYSDQFGGKDGRKFMSVKLRKLLFEIHKMPMKEQEEILRLVMTEWKGDNQQTDDMLVIGFKLNL